MRDHDVQLLIIGAAVGMELMLLLQIVFGILDDRRTDRAVRSRLRIFAADRYRDSPRRYQLQQRSRV
jgi:hypothetical protein